MQPGLHVLGSYLKLRSFKNHYCSSTKLALFQSLRKLPLSVQSLISKSLKTLHAVLSNSLQVCGVTCKYKTLPSEGAVYINCESLTQFLLLMGYCVPVAPSHRLPCTSGSVLLFCPLPCSLLPHLTSPLDRSRSSCLQQGDSTSSSTSLSSPSRRGLSLSVHLQSPTLAPHPPGIEPGLFPVGCELFYSAALVFFPRPAYSPRPFQEPAPRSLPHLCHDLQPPLPPQCSVRGP